MVLDVLACSALTELKSKVKILKVDEAGLSIFGNGVTHVFLHGPKTFGVFSSSCERKGNERIVDFDEVIEKCL